MERAYREDVDYYEERASGLLASATDGTPEAVAAFADAGAALTVGGARDTVARRHGLVSWDSLCRHLAGLRERDPFARAYAAIEAHDVDALAEELALEPEIATARGTNGNDLLGMATATCDERLVALLLERGADVAGANVHGWTALHQAAYVGLPELVRLLLDAGAPVDVSARGEGGTPLVVALFWGHAQTAELLAGEGVHPRNLRAAAGPGPRRSRRRARRDAAGRRGGARSTARTRAFRAGSRPTTRSEVLDESLAWAARNDRADVLDVARRHAARDVDADVYRGTALTWAAACDRCRGDRAADRARRRSEPALARSAAPTTARARRRCTSPRAPATSTRSARCSPAAPTPSLRDARPRRHAGRLGRARVRRRGARRAAARARVGLTRRSSRASRTRRGCTIEVVVWPCAAKRSTPPRGARRRACASGRSSASPVSGGTRRPRRLPRTRATTLSCRGRGGACGVTPLEREAERARLDATRGSRGSRRRVRRRRRRSATARADSPTRRPSSARLRRASACSSREQPAGSSRRRGAPSVICSACRLRVCRHSVQTTLSVAMSTMTRLADQT